MLALAGSFLENEGAAGGLALVNTVGIIGGFLGPYYMGLAKDFTGSYQRGFLGLALPCSLSLFLLTRLARKVKGDQSGRSPKCLLIITPRRATN